jgi:ribose transport system ATP-binding protein
MTKKQPYALADQISKRFYGTQALDKVSIAFNAGEVHALVGENGAGKSTLMKIFGGILQPDSGRILIDGAPVRFRSPREALAAGIVVIPQEIQMVPAQTVAENVLLGKIPSKTYLGILKGVDRAAMHDQTNLLLRRFFIEIDPDTKVEDLSFAERQIIMIARALNHRAKFLILDEPTAALETREAERLFEVIDSLKSLDVAVAFVSHRLEEVAEISDVCTILRDGRNVEHGLEGVPDQNEMIRLITGRDLDQTHLDGARTLGEPLLLVDRPHDHTVSVAKSEILGLAGLLGGGMTEFLREVFGAGPSGVSITLNGLTIDISSPADAIRHGIGLVPGERSQGLIMGLTVRENIVLPNLNKFQDAKGLDYKLIDDFVTDLIEAVDIRPRDPAKAVKELSGGNQQKVIFARWLAGHVDLLLLDEPTHGIDVGAKSQLHGLMNEFAGRGGGIVFASSEMTEILSISDNVLAMRSGEIVARISRQDGYNEKALLEALGGKAGAAK